jgi:hypothetical protein
VPIAKRESMVSGSASQVIGHCSFDIYHFYHCRRIFAVVVGGMSPSELNSAKNFPECPKWQMANVK